MCPPVPLPLYLMQHDAGLTHKPSRSKCHYFGVLKKSMIFIKMGVVVFSHPLWRQATAQKSGESGSSGSSTAPVPPGGALKPPTLMGKGCSWQDSGWTWTPSELVFHTLIHHQFERCPVFLGPKFFSGLGLGCGARCDTQLIQGWHSDHGMLRESQRLRVPTGDNTSPSASTPTTPGDRF